MNTMKVGLIINPLAGLGGSVALKGSDGCSSLAMELGAQPKAQGRVEQALSELVEYKSYIEFFCPPGLMGGDLLNQMGFQITEVGLEDSSCELGGTTADDTRSAVAALVTHDIDLLVFAGGDGTARDICAVLPEGIPVVGIPAGVKIHSAVYAINPQAAGALLLEMLKGELVNLRMSDVRDIDEEAFRSGVVKAKLFGEMLVPEEGRYVQMMKCGGIEKEEWVVADIAAEMVERMEDDVLYIIGSGATTQAIMDNLGLENTLLGVDLVMNHELVESDVSESKILNALADADESQLIISVIGGQGHIFGRGNQQLSPKVIRLLGRDRIQVLATKTKIKTLDGRPMLVDTGDIALDKELCGWYRVVSGYQDEIVYPVSDGVTAPENSN